MTDIENASRQFEGQIAPGFDGPESDTRESRREFATFIVAIILFAVTVIGAGIFLGTIL